MKLTKTLLILVFISVSYTIGFSQNSDLVLENGVKSHKGIDAIYSKFSEAYRTLKPEIVANLYTSDAAYLSPNDEITNGRAAILDNFVSFFKNVKNSGQNMNISFQIFQRKVEKNMGYDVGIYTINFYKDGKVINQSKGKFVTVSVKDKNNRWLFQVDGYSSLKPPANSN
jgi:hypothetical protein